MPRKKEMPQEKQRQIEEDMKTSVPQQKLNAMAAVVQQVIDEKGRAGHAADANLLLEAYRRWQEEARRLLQHHWPNNKFHRWPLLWSSFLCNDLYNLIKQLENSRNDPPVMARLLVSVKDGLDSATWLSDRVIFLCCSGHRLRYKQEGVGGY